VLLRRLVRWVDASDGNMEEGSLRCDANVSVRPKGGTVLGTKVEIKNLNSFAHVKKAIEHEIERQVAALEAGQALVQETRLFEPASGATKTMRSKEEAMDYRYFPDPDLGALVVDEAWKREVAAAMPDAFGLPAADADLVCLSRPLADYYEAAVAAHPKNPKALANWLLSELLAKMSDADRHAGRMPVAPAVLAALVRRIDDGTISGKIAKELLVDLIATGRPVDDLVKEKGLVQISDEGPIRDAVAKVLADNPAQVATYRGGKAAAFGWFVGQVMKALAGRGNPGVVNRLLRDALEKD
jgi:aspartyl-tRNA(Asn)/glutamyl-tRNA(Gln) amidotransferase subunit B